MRRKSAKDIKKEKEVKVKPRTRKRKTVAKKVKREEQSSKIKGILGAMEREVAKIVHVTEPQTPVKKTEIGRMVISEEEIPVSVNKYAAIPSGYNDTKIVVLVRDPLWIYAYWEVSNEKIEEVKRTLGLNWDYSKTILRVYDVTDIIFDGNNAHKSFDIILTGLVNSWYINIGTPDRSYCVDIGVLSPDNKFHLYARSNAVKTPRDTVSNVLDEQWLLSDEEIAKIYIPEKIHPGTSEEIGKWIKRGLKEEVSSQVKKQ